MYMYQAWTPPYVILYHYPSIIIKLLYSPSLVATIGFTESSLEVMENGIRVRVYLSIITGKILVPFNVSITANDGTATGQYL